MYIFFTLKFTLIFTETNLINDKSEADPFIPQENIFSRYATMIFSSNDNGHTFVECDSAKYCYSCGEKVKWKKFKFI